MLFRHKIQRGMEIMREKNREYLNASDRSSEEQTPGSTPEEELSEAMKKAEEFHREEKLDLEKGDFLAIILSAFLTFGPILLILAAGVVAAWFFLH